VAIPRKQEQGSKGMNLDPQTITQLVRNQAEDIALRKLELESEQKTEGKKLENVKEEQRHNKDIALAQIKAQETVFSADLTNKDRQNKRSYIFWGCSALLVVGFMVFAMYIGKEDFAETIFKFIAGGIGGYFVGAAKSKSDSNNKEKDD
jgi:hypothetical protein